MVFQKGKPRPPLKVKTCAICRKSFQPSSGAQKICGEPECKTMSRMQKYLDLKAKKNDQRVAKIDSIPAKKNHHPEGSDVPDL